MIRKFFQTLMEMYHNKCMVIQANSKFARKIMLLWTFFGDCTQAVTLSHAISEYRIRVQHTSETL